MGINWQAQPTSQDKKCVCVYAGGSGHCSVNGLFSKEGNETPDSAFNEIQNLLFALHKSYWL